MRDAHGHAFDLAAHFSTIHGVCSGEREAQQFFHVLKGPTCPKNPASFGHVGQVRSNWASSGLILLRLPVCLHHIFANGGLLEGGVHRGEIISCHAEAGDLSGMGAGKACELIHTFDGPIAAQPSISLALFVQCPEAVSHMIQYFD
jgi:hypothetical protein